MRTSNSSGATFYPDEHSLNGVTPGNNPQILSSDNDVYISWTNSSGIFFQTSTDSGKNFDDPQRVVRNSESQVALEPVYASVPGNIYMSWQELTPLPDGSIDIGVSFVSGNPITNTTESSGSSPFDLLQAFR